ELRPLEQKYADVLVTVGVHSPKFEHEADPAAVAAAVERYDVHHPVLDDPDLTTWKQYAVKAWPTLVVVDPEGYVVAQLSGEGHAHALDALLDELVREHDAKGTLHRGDGAGDRAAVPRQGDRPSDRHPAGLRLGPPQPGRAGRRRRDGAAADRLRGARAGRRSTRHGCLQRAAG